MAPGPSTLVLVAAVTDRLPAVGSITAAAALWLALLLVPVDWSVSSVPAAGSLIKIGPVSSYVVPGQTVLPAEPVDKVAAPVQVGGPFGSSVPIRLHVLTRPGGDELGFSTASAVSVPAGFDLVVFELDRPLPPSRWAYLEFEIPFETQWPILIGGTKSDLPEFPGQLFLRRQAGWPDQDLFHQLLRRQNLASRFPVIWSQHPATLLGYLAVLLPALAIFLGLGLVVGRRRPILRWPLALLPFPIMATTYFF